MRTKLLLLSLAAVVQTPLRAATSGAVTIQGIEWLIPLAILLAAGSGAWLVGRWAGRRMQRDAAQLHSVLEFADCLLWEADVELRGEDWKWTFTLQKTGLFFRLFEGKEPPEREGLWLPFHVPEQAEMDRRCRQALLGGENGYEQQFHFSWKGQEVWLRESVSITPRAPGRFWLVGIVTDITAQRATERARQTSEQALREIVARADCLVWEGRVALDREKWNWEFTIHPSGLCELLYGVREPPREAGLWRGFDIPERGEMNRRCRQAMETGLPSYTQIFHIRRKRGDEIWLHENVSLMAVDGSTFSLVGVATDITAQHWAEEARQASELAMREILERADCLLWRATILHREGRFDWTDFDLPASRLRTELLGAGPTTHATRLWDETNTPELDLMNAHSQHAMLSGASGYEQEFRTVRHGRAFWLHERVTIQSVRQDEWRAVGVVTDVTAQHEAQEARRRSEARLEELLQRTDCMIWQGWVTRSPEGELQWNLYVPRSELYWRIFGRDPEGRYFGWKNLGVPEHPEMELRARRALESGAPGYEQTFHIPRPEGDVWLTEQVTIKSAEESQWEVVGVITNITARHQAEEARREAAEQLERILELADCMVWEASVAERPDGSLDWKTYTPRSVLYRRLFGDEDGETNLDWRRLNVPELEEIHRRSVNAVSSREKGYGHEFRVILPNRIVWLHEAVTITPVEPGKFRLVGVITDISAQREAQEAHKASEEQVEQMLATVDCLLWQARVFATPGENWRWVMFVPRSRLHREIFGLDPGNPPYLSWSKVMDPETEAEIERSAKRAVFSGQTGYEQEFRVERDGHEFWLHEQVAITPIGPGEWKLVGVITDLTERRRAERTIRESEARFRTLFQHTPVAIVELDFTDVGRWLDELRTSGVGDIALALEQDGRLLLQAARLVRFVDCNSAAMTMLGARSKRDFVRRRGALATANSLGLVRAAVLSVWQGRNTLETETEMRDFKGGVHQMHVRWWMEIEEGRLDLRQSVMVLVDLTELKQAQAALAGEKERLAVTLRAMAEGVITMDVNGRVQFMNPAAAALTEQDAATAIGRPLEEICHFENNRTAGAVEVPIGQVARGDAVMEFSKQTRLIAPSGAIRLVEGCCVPIHAADSEVTGTVLVFRDVTEHARLEEELVRATRLESVGVLAGGIAHDFNNILTTVMGNISLAMLDLSTMSEAGRSLREAERAALRARDLTQQLLTFAKGGEPVRTSVRLDDVVREITDFTLHGSRVRAVFDVEGGLWPAEVDKGQIGRVVQNLVLNAVQAMPGGGTVRIMLHNERVGGPSRRALAAGRYVRITISDSGGGIKPEDISRIFDPYFTTKQKGSGLGLAAAYSIVNKHGGAIDVDSSPGHGATFRIWLPASSRAAEIGEDSKITVVPPEAGKGRVLFMDDEESIRNMAVFLLKRFGFEVVSVADGAEAVLRYAEAYSSGDPFALVIMDLTVPGGMGGREAVEKLQAIDPEVRAIVSSGYSSDPVLANYRKHGFCGVMTKPYQANDLARVLRSALGQRSKENAPIAN